MNYYSGDLRSIATLRSTASMTRDLSSLECGLVVWFSYTENQITETSSRGKTHTEQRSDQAWYTVLLAITWLYLCDANYLYVKLDVKI